MSEVVRRSVVSFLLVVFALLSFALRVLFIWEFRWVYVVLSGRSQFSLGCLYCCQYSVSLYAPVSFDRFDVHWLQFTRGCYEYAAKLSTSTTIAFVASFLCSPASSQVDSSRKQQWNGTYILCNIFLCYWLIGWSSFAVLPLSVTLSIVDQ